VEETWELAALVMAVKDANKKLRSLGLKVAGQIRAMEMVQNGTTEDFGKWNSALNFARSYNLFVKEYAILSKNTDLSVFDETKFRSSGDYVWPQLKSLFDSALACFLTLEAALSEYDTPSVTELSEYEAFFHQNLRRSVHSSPDSEKTIQDIMETLLIGRGLMKPSDYDRETGRSKTSGKEYVPDLCIWNSRLAIEVKLLKEKSKKNKMVEEMNSDIIGYKSGYDNILFVVYDLGHIQDVSEFISGFHSYPGVRVIVVKH